VNYQLTFDGHVLSDSFTIERHATRSLSMWETNLVDVPGRDGSMFGGTRHAPVSLSFDLYAIGGTRDERQQAMRALAGWLAVDEPKRLALGDECGLWRMAIPNDESTQEAYLNADYASVTFVCPDPWLYGEEHEWALGSSTTLLVGGSCEAPIDITVTGARAGTLTVTNTTTGQSLSVSGVPAGAAVSIKSSECVVTVNGTTKVLTASSRWLHAQPGENVITVTNGGTSVVASVTDRWW